MLITRSGCFSAKANACEASIARIFSAAASACLRVRVRHDQQELLAAEAAEDVVLAHALVDEPGELLQQLVARQVAVRVVVVLEVVDVEQEHREHLARARPGPAERWS